MLIGRQKECDALDALVADARIGAGGAIVVGGEAGIGKSALLEHVIETAQDCQVFRATGSEAEMELPFAALQQLLRAVFDAVAVLPEPQRNALEIVDGSRDGGAPDRLLVGLAVLNLLSELGAKQPLLCVVDDAQWLDPASAHAIAFAARRVASESVAVVFGARTFTDELRGLRELMVPPLDDNDARALLATVLRDRLDDQIMNRLVAETHGNPLALLEFPRGLTSSQLAGGFGLPSWVPLAGRLEENFRRRLIGLPADSKLLLLVAAAESTGDSQLVWRACEELEISEAAADAVEAEGLIQFSPRLMFRHPLVRSAVYNVASPMDRRHVHQALAHATDRATDPDRRAWHLAQATLRPNEDVARELEISAGRAQARGGFAAAAAFIERAMELSPDPSRRSVRALAAAEARLRAGDIADALTLLQAAADSAVDDLLRAKVNLLRAQIVFVSSRGSDATRLLLAAGQELEALDPQLARATYLEAFSAAMFAGQLARGGGAEDVSKAVLAGPPMPESPGPSDLLLQGLAVQHAEGVAAAAPLLKQSLSAFQFEAVLPPQESRWLWFAGLTALFMWDDASWQVLSTRHLELVRQSGEVSALPFLLTNRSSVFAFIGELGTAESLEQELKAVTDATGIARPTNAALTIAAVRGRENEFANMFRTVVDEATSRGEGVVVTVAKFLSGTLYNGLGRYDTALTATSGAEESSRDYGAAWTLTELIEAAVRTGQREQAQREQAQRAFQLLEESTSAAGTDWALGIEARSRALLSEDDDADRLYRDAVQRLSRTTIRVQLARTHLLYGEWLRRERRHVDARAQLRTAWDLFRDCGAEAFAERARVELEAAGERVRVPKADTGDQLTAQESQIARLAAEALTNREIAARLFISPNTVEYHLHKVFRKLDVKSRVQLASRSF